MLSLRSRCSAHHIRIVSARSQGLALVTAPTPIEARPNDEDALPRGRHARATRRLVSPITHALLGFSPVAQEAQIQSFIRLNHCVRRELGEHPCPRIGCQIAGHRGVSQHLDYAVC